ncbi:hypothetical protein DV736_g239, partial [Chaetothyriales sp. CBS 134916]
MTRYPKLPHKLLPISTKSYFSPNDMIKYLQDLLRIVPKYTHPDLLLSLIPDFITIYTCAQLLSQAHLPSPHNWMLHLGAQDCSAFDSYGACTDLITAGDRRTGGGQSGSGVRARHGAAGVHWRGGRAAGGRGGGGCSAVDEAAGPRGAGRGVDRCTGCVCA